MGSKPSNLSQDGWPRKRNSQAFKNNPRNTGSTASLNYIDYSSVDMHPSPSRNEYDQPQHSQILHPNQDQTRASFHLRDQQSPTPNRRQHNLIRTKSASLANVSDQANLCLPPQTPPTKKPTENRRQDLPEKDNDSLNEKKGKGVYDAPESEEDDDDPNIQKDTKIHEYLDSDSKTKAMADKNSQSNYRSNISFGREDILKLITVGCIADELNRQVAEEKLLASGLEIGTYMLRTSSAGGLAISLRCKHKRCGVEIRHYMIRVNHNGQVYIDGAAKNKVFSNIAKLIEYYTKKPDLRCKLKRQLGREIQLDGLSVKFPDLKLDEKLRSRNSGPAYTGNDSRDRLNETEQVPKETEIKPMQPIITEVHDVKPEGTIDGTSSIGRSTSTPKNTTQGGHTSALHDPAVVGSLQRPSNPPGPALQSEQEQSGFNSAETVQVRRSLTGSGQDGHDVQQTGHVWSSAGQQVPTEAEPIYLRQTGSGVQDMKPDGIIDATLNFGLPSLTLSQSNQVGYASALEDPVVFASLQQPSNSHGPAPQSGTYVYLAQSRDDSAEETGGSLNGSGQPGYGVQRTGHVGSFAGQQAMYQQSLNQQLLQQQPLPKQQQFHPQEIQYGQPEEEMEIEIQFSVVQKLYEHLRQQAQLHERQRQLQQHEYERLLQQQEQQRQLLKIEQRMGLQQLEEYTRQLSLQQVQQRQFPQQQEQQRQLIQQEYERVMQQLEFKRQKLQQEQMMALQQLLEHQRQLPQQQELQRQSLQQAVERALKQVGQQMQLQKHEQQRQYLTEHKTEPRHLFASQTLDSRVGEPSYSSAQPDVQFATQARINQMGGQVGINQFGTHFGLQATVGQVDLNQVIRQATEQLLAADRSQARQRIGTNQCPGQVDVNQFGSQTTHAVGVGQASCQTAYQGVTWTGTQHASPQLGVTYQTGTIERNTWVQSADSQYGTQEAQKSASAYQYKQRVRFGEDEMDMDKDSKVLSSPRGSETVEMTSTMRSGQQNHLQQQNYSHGFQQVGEKSSGAEWTQREGTNDGRSVSASYQAIASINPGGRGTLKPEVAKSGGHQSNVPGSFVDAPVSPKFGLGIPLTASDDFLTDHTERSRQQPNLIRDTSKDWQKSNSSRDDALIYQHSTTPLSLPYRLELPEEDIDALNSSATISGSGPNSQLNDSKPKMRAEMNYDAKHEIEISFRKGDILELVRYGEDNGWYSMRNLATGQEGYMRREYKTAMTNVDVNSQECLPNEFDRQAAEDKLLAPGIDIGTYLLQPSKDGYALSLRCENEMYELAIRHYMIRVNDKGECFVDIAKKNKVFSNIAELIENFTREPGLQCKLKQPLPQDIPLDDLAVNLSDLKLGEKLGSGNFGSVYAGTLHKIKQVAVKSLRAEGSMTVEEFREEAETMHKLHHPNLVSLLGICEDRGKLYIITERMSRGALLTLLREDTDNTISFKDLMHIAIQVADGMCYLEKKEFIHRDLRAANILVGDGNVTKIADFGMARLLDSYYGHEDFYGKGCVIPYKWTAPEAIRQKRFTVKSDVWSFGILLYEMVTYGSEPYPAMSNYNALEWVENGNRLKRPSKHHCPLALYNVMKQCWLTNYRERPDFEYIKDTLIEIKTYT